MSRFIVSGGNKLSGSATVQGAKNSILPVLSAALLCEGENVLFNCPRLSDVSAAARILRYLGCEVKREGSAVLVNSESVNGAEIPDSLMREMRGSIIFLGSLLGRRKKAVLTFPGGCELGPRPIDLHLKALKSLGVKIRESRGAIECTAPDGLKGAKIALRIWILKRPRVSSVH